MVKSTMTAKWEKVQKSMRVDMKPDMTDWESVEEYEEQTAEGLAQVHGHAMQQGKGKYCQLESLRSKEANSSCKTFIFFDTKDVFLQCIAVL